MTILTHTVSHVRTSLNELSSPPLSTDWPRSERSRRVDKRVRRSGWMVLGIASLSALLAWIPFPSAQAQSLVATLPSGPNPTAVAVNETTNMVYIADADVKTLLVINGATNTATTIPAGGPLAGVAVNPTTNTIYALNGGSQSSGLGGTVVTPGSVAVIDGATNAITATIALPGLATFIAVNPVTNQIYVSTLSGPVGNGVTGNVVAIDGSTNSIKATVSVPALIAQMGVDTVRNLIYVIYSTGSGNFNPSTVAAIDGTTNTVTATVVVGINDGHFALNETTNTIYVPDTHFNVMYVIDGATETLTATLPWPNALTTAGLAINPVTNTIYVTGNSNNSIVVQAMDGATNTITASITDPSSPSYEGLLVNGVTNKVWQVSSPAEVIDGATSTITSVTGTSGLSLVMGTLNTMTNYAYLAGYSNAYVINGAASGPVFSAAPSPLAFGNQTENTTSTAKTLTVTNTGTTDLTITTVTAGGTNKADFILGSDTCASSTVSAGKTCTISVEFAPSTTAAESATLSFADNASSSPQVVNLTGTGVAAVATASTTALSASATSVVVGASVTFTATVTPTSGTPTPTGTITFKDGSTTLGTVTLNSSGVATYAAASLAEGPHSITASYGGDSRNLASSSTAIAVTVTAGPSTTTLASSAASAVVGSSITLTATVTGGSGAQAPAGTVTFKDGTTTLGTGMLNAAGVATALDVHAGRRIATASPLALEATPIMHRQLLLLSESRCGRGRPPLR